MHQSIDRVKYIFNNFDRKISSVRSAMNTVFFYIFGLRSFNYCNKLSAAVSNDPKIESSADEEKAPPQKLKLLPVS